MPLKVLTRREQLELKSKAKDGEPEGEEGEDQVEGAEQNQGKGKGRGRGRGKGKGKAAAKPKATAKAEKASKAGSDAEAQVEVKTKTKAKAKAKAKARSKKGKTEKNGNDDEAEVGETKVGEGEQSDMEEVKTPVDEIDEITTPKRKLFDQSGDEGECSPQPDRQEHLKRLENEMLPKPVRKARKGKAAEPVAQSEEVPKESAPSGGSEAKGKSKGKGRGRGNGKNVLKSPKVKASVLQSPAVKKEKKRRQRRAPLILTEETLEDKIMQGLFAEHMKPVDCLTYQDLQTHLTTNGGLSGYKRCSLSVYWGRKACGVKFKGDPAEPQIAYFAYKHPKIASYNHLMCVAYVSAGLLVSLLNCR